MEIPIKMDDLGVPLFSETPICIFPIDFIFSACFVGAEAFCLRHLDRVTGAGVPGRKLWKLLPIKRQLHIQTLTRQMLLFSNRN